MKFIQIIIMLSVPFLYIVIGSRFFKFFCKLCGVASTKPATFAVMFCGLLLHITSIFILKIFGLPWCVAFFLPLILPLCIFKREWEGLRPQFSLNFTVWFFVILALGVSLFQVVNGSIETAWVNNYGDLTFHLGMISAFVKGDNFPPQFHLYAGETLSYPFFINLWSAALWWFSPDFETLQHIFVFQWVLLWCVVFFALKGDRYRILPWAILFGGGTFATVATYSWKLLDKGSPWTVFLTTIWVTQRTALLGLAASLVVLYLVYEGYQKLSLNNPKAFYPYLLFAGLVLGLSPLTHVHFCLATGLFVGIMLLGWITLDLLPKLFKGLQTTFYRSEVSLWRVPIVISIPVIFLVALGVIAFLAKDIEKFGTFFAFSRDIDIVPNSKAAILFSFQEVASLCFLFAVIGCVFVLWAEGLSWIKVFYKVFREVLRQNPIIKIKILGLLLFACTSFIGLAFLPWLLGKSEVLKIIYGWNVSLQPNTPVALQLQQAALMWLRNCGYIFMMFAAFWLVARKHLECLALVLLFLLGNFVSLATWDWDQLKIFIALYTIFIFLWSRVEDNKAAYRLHYLLIILCLPAIIEAGRLFYVGDISSPFSKKALAEAQAIEDLTPPTAIIAAAPDHNSSVLISGRKMFMGYTGTLWSHQIDYEARERVLRDLTALCTCREKKQISDIENCPDYLFWNDAASRYWHGQVPCSDAEFLGDGVYKLK